MFDASNFNAEGNRIISFQNSFTNGGEHSLKVTLFKLAI